MTEEEANNTAIFLINTVNELAVNFVDSEAGLDTVETTLIGM